MPELPEVQTIVNDLKEKIIGRKIAGLWFDAPKIIKKPKPSELEKQIKGLKIQEIKRRGKNILIYLTTDYRLQTTAKNKKAVVGSRLAVDFLLLVHQKLTGHLLYGKWSFGKAQDKQKVIVESLIKGTLQEKVNNYIHLIFYFDNGWQLGLSDLRKFAKVLFGPKEEIEKLPDLAKIGPEPLDKSFKVEKFIKLIKLEKRKIKQVLMDQEVIAGIGNIYSDEILWQAKIHPFRPAYKLKTYELKNLFTAMRQILEKAIKLRGTSISDYRDTLGKSGGYAKMLKVYPVRNRVPLSGNISNGVYRREGEPCGRCKTLIKRVKIGGRSAHYCPKCQKI